MVKLNSKGVYNFLRNIQNPKNTWFNYLGLTLFINATEEEEKYIMDVLEDYKGKRILRELLINKNFTGLFGRS